MNSDIKQASGQGEGQPPGAGEAVVPHLLFLKLMVGGLAVAMVIGLAVIALILWLRLNAPPLPRLPDSVSLPAGSQARAITFAPGRLIVVTDRDEVLVFDGDGALMQQIALEAAAAAQP